MAIATIFAIAIIEKRCMYENKFYNIYGYKNYSYNIKNNLKQIIKYY